MQTGVDWNQERGERGILKTLPVYTSAGQAHERRSAPQHGYPRGYADWRAGQATAQIAPSTPPVVAGYVRRPFDLDAFKQRWRTLCAEREVDPIDGATSFQAAAFRADMAAAARRHAPDRDWWRDPEQWRYAGPYRSTTEEAAVEAVFHDAGGAHLRRVGQVAAIIRRQVDLPPLRDHLAARGVQLSFVVNGAGGVLSFEMPTP